MLCNLVLNGVVEALNGIPFRPGEDFELIAISIDPLETPELAAKKRANYLGLYDHPESAPGWHFLVGEEEQIRKVADAVGFQYFYDPGIDEYAHASGIVLATPDGRLSRYFYGVEYPAKDLRLGLVEASEGEIGGLVEQILLLCFHYDPLQGKYGFVIQNALRAGAALTVAVLLGFLFKSLRRERRERRRLALQEGAQP
jgi:protein SCO1/2